MSPVPVGCTDVRNEGRELMVRSDLKAHPKMLASIFQGKGLGEADVFPYWKRGAVLSSGRHISPLSSGCANGSYLAVCMSRLFSGSRLIIWPVWSQ